MQLCSRYIGNVIERNDYLPLKFISVALQDILRAFRDPENVRRLDEAKDSAGNDMLRAMQTVFPVASQIEMEVIEKYGFPPDGDGKLDSYMLSFTTTIVGFFYHMTFQTQRWIRFPWVSRMLLLG